MNKELEQNLNNLINEFKNKTNNQSNTFKLIVVSIIAGISLIGSIIMAVFMVIVLNKKKETDKNDGVSIKKNSKGTQILPDTPELNKTIDEINKDILN
jgi:hypothetical protein